MYDDFIDRLPVSQHSQVKFFVKGMKYQPTQAKSTIASLVENYYTKKENFVLFSSPCQGKFTGIVEIAKNLHSYAIVADERNTDLNIVTLEEITKSNYEHIIFYNHEIPHGDYESVLTNAHVSAYYDYTALYDPKKFKDYTAKAMEKLPRCLNFTLIAGEPSNKTVGFLFGTDGDVKHLSIPNPGMGGDTAMYIKEALTPKLEAYFTDQGVKIITDIHNLKKAKRFIFYDIELSWLVKVLDNVDKVDIVYTKDDFQILGSVIEVLDGKGITVPEHVRRLTQQ